MFNKPTKSVEDQVLKQVMERLGKVSKADKGRQGEEYRLATKGIKSGKRRLLSAVFGDVGDWIDEFEEKASEEEVQEAKKKLKIGKKKREKTAAPTKAISLILRNVLDIKKTLSKIEKSLSSKTLKAGFKFDPSLGTKGGYRNTETGKIASKEEALGSSTPDRLGAMIAADEQPLVQLREQFDDFEKKTNDTLNVIKGKIESAVFSLNGITPTLGVMSVHDKLNLLMAKSAFSRGGIDIDGPGKDGKKPPPKGKGRFGRVGQVLSKAGSGIAGAASKAGTAISGAGSAAAAAAAKLGAGAAGVASKVAGAAAPVLGTAAKVAGKVAVPLAVATTAYEAGKAGMNAEETLGIQGRQATAGETAAASVGGAVEGLTFGLVSAKSAGTGLLSAGEAVSGATSKLFNWATGKADLDKVTTKQSSSVDTSNFEGGFEDRLAKMAAKFEEVTGNKLMITSGYRSEEKQKQLWDAKKAELTKAHPEWSASQVDKAVGKLVARPVAYGGKGSRHNSGLAVDINSKGSAGIEAINGKEIGGQKVSTDSFLAKYGLFRPMKHEPWHIQPLGDKPMPDNPDPNSKPLVADASGKAVDLESGKTEAIPKAEVQAGMSAGLEAPAPISGGMQIADTGGGTSTGGMQIADRGGGTSTGGLQIPDTGTSPLATREATAPGLATRPATTPGLITPVERSTGPEVAQQSTELASNQMTASMAKPAPVVINNVSNGGNQQPIQPPKTPLPKASAVNMNTTYSRAFAQDFAHPSSFTSVGVI